MISKTYYEIEETQGIELYVINPHLFKRKEKDI